MTDGYLLNLRTFREVRDDKAQALKPLEEAAVGATQGEVDAAIRRMDERNCERGRL